MADEAQYSYATNKRKYDDQPTPSTALRRPTGFSSPILPQAPFPSYNSMPSPADEIQMAKQKAQEIAARLYNSATAGAIDSKRPRVEDAPGSVDYRDKGFSSAPSDMKPMMSNSAPSAMSSYGSFQSTSKIIDVPNGRVGVIIGKAGDTIKYLQLQSGSKIQITRDMDADPNSSYRSVELSGTPEQIAKAEQLINDVLAEAETGGSGTVSRRSTGQTGSDHFVMKVANNKVGLVIGKGGETIKGMQASTGARIQVIPLRLPPGDTSTERTVHIEGTSEQIEAAKQLIAEVTSENRGRNPAMAGGYSQGYQVRPQVNWEATSGAPSMQQQQQHYGYAQPGAYPAPPQYNIPQGHYAGYPPQSTGAYSSSWDQSTAPTNQQQVTQESSYDYQSQPPAGNTAPAENTGYNYNQQATTGYPQQGQSYSQDGYGGYQAAPQSGYPQSAVYNQAQAASTVNPTQAIQTPVYGGQGDSSQAPPAAQTSVAGKQSYSAVKTSQSPGSYRNPEYGIPPTTQAEYGNPAAPAQPLYNGTSYGGTQPQKPTYPPVYGQQGYPQQASGYGTTATQPGYGAPMYGSSVASQQSYGQGEQAYTSTYNGGYGQAPVHSGDINASGNNRGGGYDDAAPPGSTTKAVQPSSVKESAQN